MSIQSPMGLYSQNGGIHAENVEIPFIPVPHRAPTANDVRYPLGKRWINPDTGNEYVLTSQTQSNGVLQSTWTLLGAGTGGALNTLTAGNSVVVTPSSGNINFVNSSNVVSTGSGANVTFDLGTNISVAGSVTANTYLSVNGGAATDYIGQAVLVNGTVTVLDTNIAAADRILVTRTAKNASTAYGTFQVVITASTNFVITSCKSDTTTETNDVSTVDYLIIKQV